MTAGRPDHDEIRDLLAAYALDAAEAADAPTIEEHLRECPRCRAELAEHRDSAALLAEGHVEPPVELWDRVAERVSAPPPLDLARYQASRPGAPPIRPAVRVAVAAAAVAALVAVATLGAVTYRQNRELDRVEAEVREQEVAVAALTAFADPSGRLVTLRSGDGALEVPAVVLPDGSGYLLAARLPLLPDEQAYQLWAIVDGEASSAGVIGVDPGIVAFTAAEAATALAISEEPAGGSEEPTLPATLTGLIGA